MNTKSKTRIRIFFAGSIGGGRQYKALYLRIIEQLKSYGSVLSEFVGKPDVEQFLQELQWTDKQCHEQDVSWLKESDVLVAECTQPSLGVGYEIARSAGMNKKILLLFQRESGMGDELRIAQHDDVKLKLIVLMQMPEAGNNQFL